VTSSKQRKIAMRICIFIFLRSKFLPRKKSLCQWVLLEGREWGLLIILYMLGPNMQAIVDPQGSCQVFMEYILDRQGLCSVLNEIIDQPVQSVTNNSAFNPC